MVSAIVFANSLHFKIYFKLILVWKQHELYLNSSSAILLWLLRTTKLLLVISLKNSIVMFVTYTHFPSNHLRLTHGSLYVWIFEWDFAITGG